MVEKEIIWNGTGVVYAVVAGKSLVFEGQVGRTENSLFVKDFRTGRLVELSNDSVKQITWKSGPSQPAQPQDPAKGVPQ